MTAQRRTDPHAFCPRPICRSVTPMPEDEIEKLYYSIGEVGEIVDQEPHVLRYWEQEFEVLSPRKNRAGRRVYTQDDVETVERIRHLLKDEKYTIEGARQAIARQDAGAEGGDDIEDDLKALRAFLVELRDQLDE
ncbi:putative transcription regulator protein [Salinibacter ruber DSM 13855]|uniref:Transcription regulator protein n=3 Tax=Salinibacter ruber TaxID=146919 RepID=Q2S1F2_SALRD|nr:putative transcription regulator protein [Salinibacter ruber DSM 13855]